ncbi:unnamed protein product, partial [Linum tenue]
MQGVELVAFGAPVTSLDFCFDTLLLAVGTDHGLVRIEKYLMILKEWNFKDKMEKIMSSNSGHIALYTLTSQDTAITSFSHDKVLAAAADASFKSEKAEELSIDDIVIDDLPPPLPQPTTTTSKHPKKEKR